MIIIPHMTGHIEPGVQQTVNVRGGFCHHFSLFQGRRLDVLKGEVAGELGTGLRRGSQKLHF